MANEPFATFPATEIRMRLRIEARPARNRPRKLLLEQEIVNPELNVPERLRIPDTLELPYLTPISVSIQVISGDAAQLSDAILSMRFKPRRTK